MKRNSGLLGEAGAAEGKSVVADMGWRVPPGAVVRRGLDAWARLGMGDESAGGIPPVLTRPSGPTGALIAWNLRSAQRAVTTPHQRALWNPPARVSVNALLGRHPRAARAPSRPRPCPFPEPARTPGGASAAASRPRRGRRRPG